MARLNEFMVKEFVRFFLKVCFKKHWHPAIEKFGRSRTWANLNSMFHKITFSDIPSIFGENKWKVTEQLRKFGMGTFIHNWFRLVEDAFEIILGECGVLLFWLNGYIVPGERVLLQDGECSQCWPFVDHLIFSGINDTCWDGILLKFGKSVESQDILFVAKRLWRFKDSCFSQLGVIIKVNFT